MRISDWSSDVCSSDLLALSAGAVIPPLVLLSHFADTAQQHGELVPRRLAQTREPEDPGHRRRQIVVRVVIRPFLQNLQCKPQLFWIGHIGPGALDRKSTRLNSSH